MGKCNPYVKDKQTALADEDARKKADQDKMQADFDKARIIKERQINNMMKNRQAIVNPYAGMTNQMANLGVANKAAEMQAEQSDIALANTLDNMRASGAGAGGATALAQAALQSKKGIAASLQQQEAANQKAAAQGAMKVEEAKMRGEEARFNAQEARDNADINRSQNQLNALTANFENAMDAYTNAQIESN